MPTGQKKTAKDKDIDEVGLYFPDSSDQALPLESINIVIVYNGEDHYTFTKSCKSNFNDGLDEVFRYLNSASLLLGTVVNKCCKYCIVYYVARSVLTMQRHFEKDC